MIGPLRLEHAVERLRRHPLAEPQPRSVALGLTPQPGGDLEVLGPAGQERLPADVAADLGLTLEDEHVVPAGSCDAGELETCGTRTEDEHPLRIGRLHERAGAPLALATDLGVVDALDAASPDHAAPAVVRGDAATDVLGLSFHGLLGPFGVGEVLAREQDRVRLARLEDLLGDLGIRDAADEQDRLRRDLLDGLRVAALPPRLVRHRACGCTSGAPLPRG